MSSSPMMISLIVLFSFLSISPVCGDPTTNTSFILDFSIHVYNTTTLPSCSGSSIDSLVSSHNSEISRVVDDSTLCLPIDAILSGTTNTSIQWICHIDEIKGKTTFTVARYSKLGCHAEDSVFSMTTTLYQNMTLCTRLDDIPIYYSYYCRVPYIPPSPWNQASIERRLNGVWMMMSLVVAIIIAL